ncbi:transcription factor WRKY45-2-like isoform X1 [Prosopis cineraria]|uniref:transcription factor WRKY45-2-like isoform X1 n=1 Tax=Prosopis cineraria TaxID=364024 RepID=UPI00241092AC|nr:transcription factor WRKY45-2-like isoform X1 [Prosopis cineraria]
MSQLELDDDIDDSPADQPLQSSIGKIPEDTSRRITTTGGVVCEPLQPSSVKVSKYGKRKTKEKTTIISESLDDLYFWKKYGQKLVRNSKFPRKYFRCTHRCDEGCQATKQVQRIDEKPHLYSITYSGKHTCTQASGVNNSSMNNQVDVIAQLGVDDIDDSPDGGIVDEPLRPSNDEVFKDKMHY